MNEAGEYRPIADTEFNRKQQQESLQRKVAKTLKDINELEEQLLKEYVPGSKISIIDLMDILEDLIRVCGGERKAEFRDVTRTMVKVSTRVPIKANLFPFLAEDHEKNEKFIKVVSRILMKQSFIDGVRWIPHEEGTFLVVTLTC
jgi:pyoverdine/dityrosine biosynthesis protein Dit1